MKKALWGLVIIIIIGLGAYFILHGNKAMAPSSTTSSTAPTAGGMQSLSALVAAGSPVTCQFASTTPQGRMQGTMYIANGMVAGDFTTQNPQAGTVNTHMLTRDNTSYVWTSLSTTGFKSTINAANANNAPSQGVSYSQPMDYQCQPWTVDSSKFSLPANISFITSASYTPPSQGAGATGAGGSNVQGTSAQCGQCDQLPAAQKAQCLAALHC